MRYSVRVNGAEPVYDTCEPLIGALTGALGVKPTANLMYKRGFIFWFLTPDGGVYGDRTLFVADRYARINIDVEYKESGPCSPCVCFTLRCEFRKTEGSSNSTLSAYQSIEVPDAQEVIPLALETMTIAHDKLSRGDY